MDKETKKEIAKQMLNSVGKVVEYLRPIIIRQDKQITDLKTDIFNTDRKLDGIKYKIIYKTKDGFFCPVCGKYIEEEIYEEGLQGKDKRLKKLKEDKIKIKKGMKRERKIHLVAAWNDDRTACGIRNVKIRYSRLTEKITCGRCRRTIGKSFRRAY